MLTIALLHPCENAMGDCGEKTERFTEFGTFLKAVATSALSDHFLRSPFHDCLSFVRFQIPTTKESDRQTTNYN
jgi:hypothetical protein